MAQGVLTTKLYIKRGTRDPRASSKHRGLYVAKIEFAEDKTNTSGGSDYHRKSLADFVVAQGRLPNGGEGHSLNSYDEWLTTVSRADLKGDEPMMVFPLRSGRRLVMMSEHTGASRGKILRAQHAVGSAFNGFTVYFHNTVLPYAIGQLAPFGADDPVKKELQAVLDTL